MSTLFINRFNALPKIAFNAKWGNGTGYFDYCVNGAHAPKLLPGEQAATTSDNDRKIIITGTPIGNVVVFQRYSDRDDILVYNASREFNSLGLIINKRLSVVETELIIGNQDNMDKDFNINSVLQNIVNASCQPYWNKDSARSARDVVTVSLGNPEDTKYCEKASVLLIGEATCNGNTYMYALANNGYRVSLIQLKSEDNAYEATHMLNLDTETKRDLIQMFNLDTETSEDIIKAIKYFHKGADALTLETLISLNLHKVKELPSVEWAVDL